MCLPEPVGQAHDISGGNIVESIRDHLILVQKRLVSYRLDNRSSFCLKACK